MKAKQFMLTPSNGKYICNEHTTEYGNIALDGSPLGCISDCFIYRVQHTINGHRKSFIDHYITKENGTIATVRMVLISNFETSEDQHLAFASPTTFTTPVFDIAPWQKIRSEYDEYSFAVPVFIDIEEEKNVKLIHNGKDTFLLVYGDSSQEVFLSESISFFFDSENNLQGIKVFSPEYVPEMLARLERSMHRDAGPVEIEPSGMENLDKPPRLWHRMQRKFKIRHR